MRIKWYVIYGFPCPSFSMISKNNLYSGIAIGLVTPYVCVNHKKMTTWITKSDFRILNSKI